jgi:hypothetical protein
MTRSDDLLDYPCRSYGLSARLLYGIEKVGCGGAWRREMIEAVVVIISASFSEFFVPSALVMWKTLSSFNDPTDRFWSEGDVT